VNQNETTNVSSSNQGSRRLKLILERLVIECEDAAAREEFRAASNWEIPRHLEVLIWRLLDAMIADASASPNSEEHGRSQSKSGAANVPSEPANDNDVNQHGGGRSVGDWPLPGTDYVVRICASPEGLGQLARRDATLVDAFTRVLQMLLQQARRPKGEPVTLEAVTISSAA
jgi:hypothetical protein